MNFFGKHKLKNYFNFEDSSFSVLKTGKICALKQKMHGLIGFDQMVMANIGSASNFWQKND